MRKNSYKTCLIDEAVFLIMSGFKNTSVESLERLSAVWTFQETPRLKKTVEMFWQSNVKVDLHRWLSVRSQLKYEQCRSSSLPKKKPYIKKTNLSVYSELSALCHENRYYYKDSAGSMATALLGRFVTKDSVHYKRFIEGNFFKNKNN